MVVDVAVRVKAGIRRVLAAGDMDVPGVVSLLALHWRPRWHKAGAGGVMAAADALMMGVMAALWSHLMAMLLGGDDLPDRKPPQVP